jgi:hypothetical protein
VLRQILHFVGGCRQTEENSLKILFAKSQLDVDACKKEFENHRDIMISFYFLGGFSQIPIAKFITLFRNSDFVAHELWWIFISVSYRN